MPNNKKIYGIIGYPIKHSLSKAMQEVAFKTCGINAEYRLISVLPEDLKDFWNSNKKVTDIDGNSISISDLSGFNVTIPHKVAVFKLHFFGRKNTTVVSTGEILLAGAVNTVKRDNKSISCHNTDIKGFIESLRQNLKFDWNNKNIFIFGCGGVGKAVVAGLMPQAGAKAKKIYIYEPNEQACVSAKKHFEDFDLADKLEFILETEISQKIKDSHLLVNASPIGMKDGDHSVIDKELLHKDLYVYDVVYNRETQLMTDAKSQGVKNAVGGLGMLLYQGILAFTIWTGKPAPQEIMQKALLDALKGLENKKENK